MHPHTTNSSKRPHHIKRHPQRWTIPHNLQHAIRAPPLRHLPYPSRHIILREIQRHSTEGFCALQPRGDRVDGEDMCGGVFERGDEGAEANGAAAKDDHGSCPLLGGGKRGEGVTRGVEPGGEDIGHEDECFLWDGGGRFEERPGGHGDAHVLGLPAVEVAAAEEEGVRAAGGFAVEAVEAVEAGGGEGGDDFIADLEVRDVRAEGGDAARELVPHDEVGFTLLVPAEYMQLAM